MADTSLVFNILAKDKTQGTLKGFAGGLKKAFLPAVAVLGAVTAGAVSLVKAGEEAATSNARITQIFSSMGEKTDAAAKATIAYAEARARATGIDQNQIKAGDAILATFSKVSDATARQTGLWKRAQDAAVDLSAAGFGDVATTAKQLGKALQDPIKGINAMARSGVSFTDAEKKQIKTLVEHGQTLKAQNIIMKAVETQVGGVANATANSSDKMKVSWSQAKESLGQALLPAFEKLTVLVMKASDWMAKHRTTVLILAGAVGILAAAIVVMNIAMMVNPAGLILAAIIGLAAGMIWLYKNVKWVRDIFNALQIGGLRMAALLVQAFKFIVDAVLGFVGNIIHGAALAFGWVPGLGPKLKTAAAKFDEFRVSVNKTLDGVTKKLNITADTTQARRAIDALRYNVQSNPFVVSVAYRNASSLSWPSTAGGAPLKKPGMKAAGGPVTAGMPYIVGEHRPELFVPSQNGTIIPKVPTMAGGGSRVEVHHQPIIVRIGARDVAYAQSDFNVLVPGAA